MNSSYKDIDNARSVLLKIKSKAEEWCRLGVLRNLESTIKARCSKEILEILKELK